MPGLPGKRHASMEAALEPPAVQSSGAPVPDGPGGPQREPAGDQRGPDLQVGAGGPVPSSVSVFLTVPLVVTCLCLDRDDYSSGLLLKKSGLSITEKWRGSSASPTSLREWLRPERSPFFLLWLIEMQVDSWLFSAKLKICLGDYQLFYSNIR